MEGEEITDGRDRWYGTRPTRLRIFGFAFRPEQARYELEILDSKVVPITQLAEVVPPIDVLESLERLQRS